MIVPFLALVYLCFIIFVIQHQCPYNTGYEKSKASIHLVNKCESSLSIKSDVVSFFELILLFLYIYYFYGEPQAVISGL